MAESHFEEALEEAARIERQIASEDETIDGLKDDMKASKENRERLIERLREIVRTARRGPGPLFAEPEASEPQEDEELTDVV